MDLESEETAVLLIAHGSRRESANADLRELAERIESLRRWRAVVACFLELAEPDIAAGALKCVSTGASRVLMVPYFLSAGVHLLRDLTAARDDLRVRNPEVTFALGSPLGPHPLLDRLVLARVEELQNGVGEVVASADQAALQFEPLEDWVGRAEMGGRDGREEAVGRLDEITEKD